MKFSIVLKSTRAYIKTALEYVGYRSQHTRLTSCKSTSVISPNVAYWITTWQGVKVVYMTHKQISGALNDR